jgi:hypothetical protein
MLFGVFFKDLKLCLKFVQICGCLLDQRRIFVEEVLTDCITELFRFLLELLEGLLDLLLETLNILRHLVFDIVKS